ncbi:MAG: YihA family ribosome biogenesis GTP-binding protein [Nitrospira sp.]|nr:YihA family ribosome biogenesis GTP-binding protein [Nitrospira sp.]MBS0153766.1 YihA family ribosome biogenesis GTP-binding protein [Nitrospira sp.]
MKIFAAEFIKSCVDPEQFPSGDLREIAFVGRSNVGKSSLINSLLNRRELARVSRTPGKTQAVNVFLISTSDPHISRFYLVDLPGYGFANVPKTVRIQWGPLLERYLLGRAVLLRVVLLVDGRVVTDQDCQTMAWLRSIGHDPLIVVTKVDKLKSHERVKTLRRIHQSFGLAEEDAVIPYSSVTGEGRDRLWGALRETARQQHGG